MIKCIFIGFFSGIISGMGIGGGAILIPSVIFFCNLSQIEAQYINLIYFIPTAISALILHNKNNNIEKKIIKPLIIYGILGAILGSFLALLIKSINENILMKFFGVFIGIMGIIELFKK